MKKQLITALALALALSACQKEQTFATNNEKVAQTDRQEVNPHDPHSIEALTQSLQDETTDQMAEIDPIKTADGKLKIDWQYLDTHTKKADLATYTYPIALESQAVKNYAKAYNLSDKQALHSIVVNMAAPEALNKLLDQLEGYYLSHEITDGADVRLIVHTKSDFVADNYEYVFADKFGEGLTLPIEIRPAK